VVKALRLSSVSAEEQLKMAASKDKMGRPIVVVTGLGVVTSLGCGKTDNWAKLAAGESGIKTITRFSTEGLRTRIAGTIDYLPPQSSVALTESIAELAAEEAIMQSALGTSGQFPGPLFLAVPPIEIEWPQRLEIGAKSGANGKITYSDLLRASAGLPDYHRRFLLGSVADNLAEKFGTQGSPISLSTACASGATAVQLGVEAIRRGETDAALCVGTDGSINPEAVVRFSLLSALSTSNDVPQAAAKPFSKNRDGFVMAEGAGALVLESYDAAKARGAKILGVVEGCGEMTDAFHRTRSSPDGKPIIGCMVNAIRDAGLTPGDIDYINAHGTSTPENDKMEYFGCANVFGERIKFLPISSNKSMIGHTLSAAGAVEAVFTLLTLQHQRIPPTINYAMPDPAIPLDVVPNRARDASLRHAISNSFGFGGQNVSLVMGLEPA
jgi:3-oxoacyl-[acyl-carrier-protein] synthase II